MSVQKETESGEVGDLLGGRGSQLLEVLSLWGFRGFFPATDYLTYLCSFSISIYLASYTFLFYFSCPSFFFFPFAFDDLACSFPFTSFSLFLSRRLLPFPRLCY